MSRREKAILLLISIMVAIAAMLLADPGEAKADSGFRCTQSTGIWLFKGNTRTICDSPQRADGSWTRLREFWTPEHYVRGSGYCSRYSCSYSEGYWQETTSNGVEQYIVFPDNVLADEPGHIA